MSSETATTVVSIAGIAGTLLGVVATAFASARTARNAALRQDRAEARQARRHAYATLSAVLVVCTGNVAERMSSLIRIAEQHPDNGGQRFIQRSDRMGELIESQLQAVTDALGPVLIEGPDHVARLASTAVQHLRLWNERVDDWRETDGAPEDISTFILEQERFGREDMTDTQATVEAFNEACRRALYPEE